MTLRQLTGIAGSAIHCLKTKPITCTLGAFAVKTASKNTLKAREGSRLEKKAIIAAFLVLAVVSIAGCSKPPANPEPPTGQNYTVSENPLPKGDRLLGIDVNPASDNDFGTAFAKAKEAGLQVVQLSLAWDDIEPSPGQYKDPGNFLATANAFYPGQNTKLALMIGAIDTTADRRPADLKGKAFDDPVVIERYNKMIDFVFSQVPSLELQDLSIGNEIDVFLGNDSAKWQQYSNFFKETAKHARAAKTGLKVGSKATFKGLTKNNLEQLKAINANADIVLATYYPINDDSSVKDLKAVGEDFDSISSVYSGKEIYFLEAGAPSSETLGSSFEKQAGFVKQIFIAWDVHKEQVKVVNFVWLHDVSQSALDDFSRYYGSSDPKFLAYLGSLGLRTNDAKDKPAWTALKLEAKARGW